MSYEVTASLAGDVGVARTAANTPPRRANTPPRRANTTSYAVDADRFISLSLSCSLAFSLCLSLCVRFYLPRTHVHIHAPGLTSSPARTTTTV